MEPVVLYWPESQVIRPLIKLASGDGVALDVPRGVLDEPGCLAVVVSGSSDLQPHPIVLGRLVISFVGATGTIDVMLPIGGKCCMPPFPELLAVWNASPTGDGRLAIPRRSRRTPPEQARARVVARAAWTEAVQADAHNRLAPLRSEMSAVLAGLDDEHAWSFCCLFCRCDPG
jgi:hypothetical protein